MISSFPRWAAYVALAGTLVLSVPSVRAASSEDYAQAEALVREGQWDQGIELLRQLLEREPDNLKALNLVGIALTGKGDLAGANREFQHAVGINPRFVPALKNLALNEFTQKNVAAAEKHFSQALAAAPDDPVIHAYLGHIAYSRNQYQKAAAHLVKSGSLRHDPAVVAELAESCLEIGEPEQAFEVLSGIDRASFTPQQQFRLGLALAERGLYSRAIPYFESVQAAYPDSYDAAFNLGVCYVLTKQFPQAIAVLTAIAEHGHKTAELDNLLAEAFEGNRQIQPAIDALREATQLDPKDENNYVDLATLCTNYDAFDLGLKIIAVGLHYHPQSDRLIFQRGVLEAMTNRFDVAENDFQLAGRLAPNKDLTYVAMGVSYMQTGHFPEAIQSLRDRIKQKPDDPVLLYLLGDALIRSGTAPGDATFREAQSSLEKSVKLNPDLAPSQVDLGKLYLKDNRLNDARQRLERALAIDPKDKTAIAQLAIVYRKAGKPELAGTMLTSLNKLNEEDRQQDHKQRLHIAEAPVQASQP
jgi:tetratricopeptide (TPR) repeat protein